MLGDLGTTNNSVATMQHMFDPSKPPFSALLHVGDLSYADGEQPVWDEYADIFQAYSTRVPWMTAIGNHGGS